MPPGIGYGKRAVKKRAPIVPEAQFTDQDVKRMGGRVRPDEKGTYSDQDIKRFRKKSRRKPL